MDKRVSPVFDVSLAIDIYDSEGYGHSAAFVSAHSLPATLGGKISFLLECDIDTVICGALTKEGEDSLFRSDIETYSFIRGSVDQVVKAWESGELSEQRFFLPGCLRVHHCRRMRRNRRRIQV